MDSTCVICGSSRLGLASVDYLGCQDCGHQMLVAGQRQALMVNDDLSARSGDRPSGLIRFQSAVVDRVAKSRRLLVDIGCGSGAFLHHNHQRFTNVVGVEVSAPSLTYARRTFGLPVETELPEDLPTPSVVTFWHSLEHIPMDGANALLARLQAVADTETQLVVSVPNARSILSRLFGRRSPFYDVPHHLHQFSPQSLDLLMQHHGFVHDRDVFSPAYIMFGYVQGFLNVVQSTHNYVYYRKKRGWDFGLSSGRRRWLDVWNVILMPAALVLAVPCFILDYAIVNSRGVLTTCYRKKL